MEKISPFYNDAIQQRNKRDRHDQRPTATGDARFAGIFCIKYQKYETIL